MSRDNVISLFDVLQIIDGFDADGLPNKFSISWCTLDKKKESGGRTINAEKCMKVVGKRKGELLLPTVPKAADKLVRNPRHFKNQTRNIAVNGTGNIRKIHIRLITRFNGKVVSW